MRSNEIAYILGDCYIQEISKYNTNLSVEIFGYPGIGTYKKDFNKTLESFLIKEHGIIVLAFGHVDIRKAFKVNPNTENSEIIKIVNDYVDYCDNLYKNFDVFYIDPFPQISGRDKKILDDYFSIALERKVKERRIISQNDILIALDRSEGISDEDYIEDKFGTGTYLNPDLSKKFFNLVYEKTLTL